MCNFKFHVCISESIYVYKFVRYMICVIRFVWYISSKREDVHTYLLCISLYIYIHIYRCRVVWSIWIHLHHMFICIYINMYRHIPFLHLDIHVYILSILNIRKCIYMYVYLHTYTHIYMYVYSNIAYQYTWLSYIYNIFF